MIYKYKKINMQILLIIIVFLNLITYIIIFDIIMSWLNLAWINFRPKLISNIIDPLYKNVKKIFPTTLWPLEFTPIIVIISIMFIKWALFIIFPELQSELTNLIK